MICINNTWWSRHPAELIDQSNVSWMFIMFKINACYIHTHTYKFIAGSSIYIPHCHSRFFCAAAECFRRMFHQNSIEHRGRFNDNRCPLLKASKNSLKRVKENLIDLLSMLSMQFVSPYIQALIPIDTKKKLVHQFTVPVRCPI